MTLREANGNQPSHETIDIIYTGQLQIVMETMKGINLVMIQ